MSRRDLIEDFCNEYGYDFREKYTGRCMYSKFCVGIVYDVDDDVILGEFEDYLTGIEEFDFAESIRDLASFDCMGLSRIIYFPSIL